MSDGVTIRPTAYRRAVAEGGEHLRAALFDAASELLSSEGTQALSLRRIAAVVGCSTTVLYTVFGSKAGITEALYREGFARFAARLSAVPPGPPVERLLALATAYRDNALTQRHYYGIMFGDAVPGFTPSAEAVVDALATMDVLAVQVRACIDAGVLAGDAQEITEVLWAASHGAVSLELSGFFPDEATALARFESLTRAAGMAYRPET